MKKKTKTFLLVLGLVLSGTFLSGQNNLIPEFTVDGTFKVFRDTLSTGGVDEIEQRTTAVENGGAVETTLVQETVGTGDRTELYIRIENGALLDVGGRIETGGTVSEETVVQPLSDYAVRPVLDEERSDTGLYELEILSGNTVVSDASVEVSQTNRFLSGFEEVTVPAGIFPNAVRAEVTTEVETTTNVAGGPVTFPSTVTTESTQWYVNGIGLVKQVTTTISDQGTETATRELLSHTIPGAVPSGPPEVIRSGGSDILPLWSGASSFARPSGWMWTQGEWEWSNDGQFWYWIPPGPPFVQNTVTGQVVPRPINGWNFYDWPYFWNADSGTWYFIFQGNLPFVFNPSTNQWRTWGE